jgi:Ulp1 family protease
MVVFHLVLTFLLTFFLFNFIIVPRQDNGSDCGVFVCRYALAMFKLRHLEFTNKEAGLTGQKMRGNAPFSKLITYGEEFHFDCGDIHRIRVEYQTSIRNLHQMFDQFTKKKEDKQINKQIKAVAATTLFSFGT